MIMHKVALALAILGLILIAVGVMMRVGVIR